MGVQLVEYSPGIVDEVNPYEKKTKTNAKSLQGKKPGSRKRLPGLQVYLKDYPIIWENVSVIRGPKK